MIAEIGLVAPVVCRGARRPAVDDGGAGVCGKRGQCPRYRAWRMPRNPRRPGRPAAVRSIAVVQGMLALVAMTCLIAVFVRSDMSVKLVVENSHSAKPLLYKIAGAWGNHEGSMLLWVTILGLAGGAVALFERRLPQATLIATLGAQATIALGFYAFLALASNPFARVDPAAADGQGLNPLLQDPGLAFHPADALRRLCRSVGGVQLCRRRTRHPRRRPGVCAGDATLGAGAPGSF